MSWLISCITYVTCNIYSMCNSTYFIIYYITYYITLHIMYITIYIILYITYICYVLKNAKLQGKKTDLWLPGIADGGSCWYTRA